ncbi:hypothetical protein BWR17_12855 [Phaeobacter inhibens]|nr:hypothetical protein BWR17_12855 [Phaeobacter inhibens]
MRPYRVVRHPQLAEDLNSIAFLIAEYAGTAVALRKIGEIEDTIGKLRQVPHIGSIRDNIAPGVRAIPTAGKGVVCFVVDDKLKEVVVLAASYAGSDWSTSVRLRSQS